MRDKAYRRRHVAVSVGGTLGHVHAGVAIAKAYSEAHPSAKVWLVGPRQALAHRAVADAGMPSIALRAHPFVGQRSVERLASLATMAYATARALHFLRRNDIEITIGCGGYASLSLILAARILGIATVIYEANAVPGLANRLLAPLVDRVFVGWAAEQRNGPFGAKKSTVVGIPVRPDLLGRRPQSNQGPPEGSVRFAVLGGSQGSAFIDEVAVDLFVYLRKQGLEFEVLHQCVGQQASAIRQRYRASGISAKVQSWFDDMSALYGASDFAVSAAGSISLAELAAYGIPSLLLPLGDSADQHQQANAALYCDLTGCSRAREENWDARHQAQQIRALLRDPTRWRRVVHGLKTLPNAEAGARIVTECEDLLRHRRGLFVNHDVS